MNKTLWKLQSAGDRLWLLANASAQQSATSGLRGLAVVAEETCSMANKIYEAVERALFGEDSLEHEEISDIAFMLNLLALNSAIESHRNGWQGKAAAVCAEDIRNLAQEVAKLLDANAGLPYSEAAPSPKSRITSVDTSQCFIHLDIGGVAVVELLDNIKEICIGVENLDSHTHIRGMKLPFINGFKMLGKTQENPTTYVVLYTPWAEQNKTYAVAANVLHLFYSPIGTPTHAPADMPLAEYVRECWESENDKPFLFMDWPNMVCK
jgi:hypothetical protein